MLVSTESFFSLSLGLNVLYDLDWLNNSKIEKDRCPQDADGNILYSSVETLYDYLVNKKESKE